MFSCKDITKKANQYIEHELPWRTRLKVRLHLFVCLNCRRYLQQLQLTVLTLGQMQKQNDNNISPEKVTDIVKHLQKATGDNIKKGD